METNLTQSSTHQFPRLEVPLRSLRNAFQVLLLTKSFMVISCSHHKLEWRKLLKDLILYFREVQSSYEHRSKALLKISNIINNTTTPPAFLTQGGVDDALHILRNYHKQAVAESSKAKDVENDVISQLSGLRSDLNQKIKEIKSLSGDFKNSVDREKEGTRKAVDNLQNALDVSDANPSSSSVGKGDPFVVRLAVDRQVEKQIEEENYLHRVSTASCSLLII